MEHLTLPVLDDTQSREVGTEVLEVEPAGAGRWRLLHSPAFVFGMARGDIIRLEPQELCGFVVLERAGNLAVVLALPSDEKADSRQALEREVTRLGGICEGGPSRILVFSIPVSAGFPEVEEVFDGFCARAPGTEWWFGNVYGPDDSALRWWVK